MLERLAHAQSERVRAIDATLPALGTLPAGERIDAAVSDGRTVAGMLYRATYPAGSWESLWSASLTFELTPLLGEAGGAGMAALLRAWRDRMGAADTGADSACAVTWPSRDVDVTSVLLEHGFGPRTAIAVRTRASEVDTSPADVRVRRASTSDEDDIVALELAELDYAAAVGAATVRRGARRLLAAALRHTFAVGDPVWVAEVGGLLAGVAHCGWVTVAGSTGPIDRYLPDGRWGFIRTLSVAAPARGQGIGRALMRRVHRDFGVDGAGGTFVFYSPTNPLSSVFWHRQGYRPLWTIWEIRPAAALR